MDGLVVPVERATGVISLDPQLVKGGADLRRHIPALGQPCRKQTLLNVAVGFAVGPVVEMAVTQLVAEQRHDAVLRGAFGLANRIHFKTSKHPALVGLITLVLRVPVDLPDAG